MSLNKYGTGIVEDKDGNKYHLVNGKLDSENDKPSVELANGDMLWHKDGLLHRENGPAVLITAKGVGTPFYESVHFLHGVSCSLEEYNKILQQKEKSKKKLNIIKQIYTTSLLILFPNFIIFAILDSLQITKGAYTIPFILLMFLVFSKMAIIEFKNLS